MRVAPILFAAALTLTAYACKPKESTNTPVITGTETSQTANTAPTTAAVEKNARGNPCSWVSLDEVNAIAGTTMIAHPGDHEEDCSFRSTDDKTKFILQLWTTDEGYAALTAFKGVEEVPGLGERAIWIPMVTTVSAVKNHKQIDVRYYEAADIQKSAPIEEQKSKSIALAQKLIGHL